MSEDRYNVGFGRGKKMLVPSHQDGGGGLSPPYGGLRGTKKLNPVRGGPRPNPRWQLSLEHQELSYRSKDQ